MPDDPFALHYLRLAPLTAEEIGHDLAHTTEWDCGTGKNSPDRHILDRYGMSCGLVW